MSRVAIIDYGMSNLGSVVRAVEECGGRPEVTDGPKTLAKADYIILPGVGVFADGMENLRSRGYETVLQEQVLGRKVPFLGICLGMQLLAKRGSEGGETVGLGWIEGEVKHLEPTRQNSRIPHVGWNEVLYADTRASSCPLFKGIPNGQDFYFVHSFHLSCERTDQIVSRTPYCGGFVSAVRRDPIFGVQFHPEKSQKRGFQVLRNFLSM